MLLLHNLYLWMGRGMSDYPSLD